MIRERGREGGKDREIRESEEEMENYGREGKTKR